MRRLADRGRLLGLGLLILVLAVTRVLYVAEHDRRAAVQRAARRQATTLLQQSVDDSLAREVALARVLGVSPAPSSVQWSALANIVTSQPIATGAGFIQPVPESGRAGFEARTGLRLVQSLQPGRYAPAVSRPVHMVVTDYASSATHSLTLGLDLAANPMRRALLLESERTGRPVATPPTQFLARPSGHFGVVVYAPVRRPDGRFLGWVTVSYDTHQLAKAVDSHGVKLTITDGTRRLVGRPDAAMEPAGTVTIAGRRWNIRAASIGTGSSSTPWLVLGFGLSLTIALAVILRQFARRERYAHDALAQREAEEAALNDIATLVAENAPPERVFAAVAEQVGRLFGGRIGIVVRFDREAKLGRVVGEWSPDGRPIGTEFALDGPTASAEVYRTGRPARMPRLPETTVDGSGERLRQMGGVGTIATPITVAGQIWGAVGAAFAEAAPPRAERRLERFGRLVGLALANADAWQRLTVEATTDPLTGLANRRVFDERSRSELARAARYGRPLSLALFDLDHFKSINDQFGHQAGDRVLARMAQILTTHVREGELVARLGGEEFGWLMPETDAGGAFTAAERVRLALEAEAFGDLPQITVSCGVATAIDGGYSAEALFAGADQALYAAKARGRNLTGVHRVSFAAAWHS